MKKVTEGAGFSRLCWHPPGWIPCGDVKTTIDVGLGRRNTMRQGAEVEGKVRGSTHHSVTFKSQEGVKLLCKGTGVQSRMKKTGQFA